MSPTEAAEAQLARTRAAMADLTHDELVDLNPDHLETAGADQA